MGYVPDGTEAFCAASFLYVVALHVPGSSATPLSQLLLTARGEHKHHSIARPCSSRPDASTAFRHATTLTPQMLH